MATVNVLTICGSLRKGSYNAMVQRALPALAPDGMTLNPAPPFTEFPLYNADIQNSTGFPVSLDCLDFSEIVTVAVVTFLVFKNQTRLLIVAGDISPVDSFRRMEPRTRVNQRAV